MEQSARQWESDYCRRQERINGYARRCFQPRIRTVEKFLICHPDEYRRYLRQHPCAGCRANTFCDQPCGAYLQWYNTRLEAVRRRT